MNEEDETLPLYQMNKEQAGPKQAGTPPLISQRRQLIGRIRQQREQQTDDDDGFGHVFSFILNPANSNTLWLRPPLIFRIKAFPCLLLSLSL